MLALKTEEGGPEPRHVGDLKELEKNKETESPRTFRKGHSLSTH